MRRTIWIIVLAVVAFVVIVIARLPATWVVPTSSAPVTCAAVDGSIWNGSCSGLTVQGTPLGDMTWNIHALRLLTGKLAAFVVLMRPTGSLHGDFAVGLDKNLTIRNAQLELPLDHDVMMFLPRTMQTLRGNARANIVSARIQKGIITELQGVLELHDLEDHGRTITAYGSYALTFPPGSASPPVGQLHDLGGPLAVEGTVKLMQDKPGFAAEGYVTARADAAPSLLNDLQLLGSPDAQGRRQFGPIESTF
ncbi:MAG TPA: type II secretion system protein N [Steroidobacteraceae bacterium]|nr:type II secretion system protein N [Steroidobacteraceae bacterium]